MRIYLVRHADALPLGENDVLDDDLRELSESGHHQAQQVGRFFLHHEIRPGVLLSSPLIRAKQTALGIASVLDLPAEAIQECDELAPAGKSRKLAKVIETASVETIVLVGHQPDLGRHTGWMIGSKKIDIAFPKAGVCLVEVRTALRKGAGELHFLLPPERLG